MPAIESSAGNLDLTRVFGEVFLRLLSCGLGFLKFRPPPVWQFFRALASGKRPKTRLAWKAAVDLLFLIGEAGGVGRRKFDCFLQREPNATKRDPTWSWGYFVCVCVCVCVCVFFVMCVFFLCVCVCVCLFNRCMHEFKFGLFSRLNC